MIDDRLVRYLPVFKELASFKDSIINNEIVCSRKEAVACRDKEGKKPVSLIKIRIIPLKWVKKR